MSFVTPFGKRKVYLINHDPINQAKQLDDLGVAFSKFLALQILNEFRDASYNDLVSGELFVTEEAARRRLYHDEYYLELSIPAEAISHTLPDGHVFIKAGYAPKIMALKTFNFKTYYYNDMKGFYQEMPRQLMHGQKIYNHNPERWSLYNLAETADN